jgi:uncharacterized protein (DUF433 family)
MPTTVPSHIEIDEQGRAAISGTRMRVNMIAICANQGMTPAEIVASYPHLSLGQIHAALGYYYDHQREIDAYNEQVDREVESLRLDNEPRQRALIEKLKKRMAKRQAGNNPS